MFLADDPTIHTYALSTIGTTAVDAPAGARLTEVKFIGAERRLVARFQVEADVAVTERFVFDSTSWRSPNTRPGFFLHKVSIGSLVPNRLSHRFDVKADWFATMLPSQAPQ
jgi:hypothetical protein